MNLRLITFCLILLTPKLFAQLPPVISAPFPEIPTRDIINTSFEINPAPNVGSWSVMAGENGTGATKIAGWKSTHPTYGGVTNPLEVWDAGFDGVFPPTGGGNQFVEINLDASAALYQDVCLTAGDSIFWLAHHRGRTSATVADSAEFFISNPANWTAATVTYTGAKNYSQFLATSSAATPTNGTAVGGGWALHSGQWVCSTTGAYRVAFQAVSTAGGNVAMGNFIDSVVIAVSPQITFLATDNASRINAEVLGEDSVYYLSLAINGTLRSAADVTISLGSSSALSGADFTVGLPFSGTAGLAVTGVTATKSGDDIILHLPAFSFNINEPNHYITVPLNLGDLIPEKTEQGDFYIKQTQGGGLPNGLYRLKIGEGCVTGAQNSVSLTVIDNEEPAALEIPNIFTPNSDGKNDKFVIFNKSLQTYDLKIYNRWGQVVFTSVNGDSHWDGNLSNGNQASDGTYYYVLKVMDYLDKSENYTGFLTLIR